MKRLIRIMPDQDVMMSPREYADHLHPMNLQEMRWRQGNRAVWWETRDPERSRWHWAASHYIERRLKR
jgi:hypothetical protein